MGCGSACAHALRASTATATARTDRAIVAIVTLGVEWSVNPRASENAWGKKKKKRFEVNFSGEGGRARRLGSLGVPRRAKFKSLAEHRDTSHATPNKRVGKTPPARPPPHTAHHAMAPLPPPGLDPSTAPPVQVFVFDDRLGKKEGQELEKVLAFFPSASAPNTMAAAVGLVEGVTGFMSQFTPEAEVGGSNLGAGGGVPTQVIHSKKRRVRGCWNLHSSYRFDSSRCCCCCWLLLLRLPPTAAADAAAGLGNAPPPLATQFLRLSHPPLTMIATVRVTLFNEAKLCLHSRSTPL